MRITHHSLQSRVYTLNEALERPVTQFASKVGEPTKFNVGHLCLEHNEYGYSLEEVTSEQGAVHVLATAYTAHDMDTFINGIMHGVGLRNAHLTEQLLRKGLHNAGLVDLDYPLYKADAAHDELVAKYKAMTASFAASIS